MSRFSLALALITAASAAQESPAPPKLQVRPPAAGDRTEIKVESTIELDIETRNLQEAEATQKRQLTYVRTMECSQVVQSVADNGAPTYRVSVTNAKLQRSGTNMAPATDTSEIESQSYVVTQGDKGRVVKHENGDPAPGDALGLGAWEDLGKLLPSGESKEGATWKVDAAAASAFISIPDLVAPSGTFEAKVEGAADGKMTVFFSGNLAGKTSKGFDVKLSVAEGRLVFDTTKGRPVSLSLLGSLTATKDIFQKVAKAKELRQVEEKVGDVTVTSKKLEVKAEFK
jgi:hypothetical protein